MPYFYINWMHFIWVLPAVLFAMYASYKVRRTFDKYSNSLSRRRLTGADAARRVLNANGLSDIAVELVAGKLTDHYDPKAKVIRLSEATYSSCSTAAIGVAAHEAGHAVQHATGYLPIKLRSAIIPATNIGSRLAMPLIFLGILLSAYGAQYSVIAYIGVALFGLSAVFQLVTLPTEFNASRRAIEAIEQCGLLDGEEIAETKKVLSAAAMTYVAALAVALMQLLRLVFIVRDSSNRRR